MPAVVNHTPFSAEVFGLLDAKAQEHLVLVVSASFVIRPGQEPGVAEEQRKVRPVDEYRKDPASSSVLYPGDLALDKPAVDVVVNGQAYAPHGRKTETMAVGLRIADINKALLVSGDRFWKAGITGRVPSSPRPFVTMPVIYERAFGGGSKPSQSAPVEFEARNPVGVGINGAPPIDSAIETEVANIEYASSRVDSISSRPLPGGFGAIAPGWQPRVGYAGTYDDAWLKEQAPLLPHDFDPRFYQVAPGDQQSRRVQGGEWVEVVGMTPDGGWRFPLPTLDVPVHLAYRDRMGQGALKIDTVLLEPDQYRLTLTARLAIPVIRNRAPLAQIVLGKVGRGWLRARFARKVYRSRQKETE